MKDIKSMLPEEIEAELKTMGQPKFRAGQIFDWLTKGVQSFDEMSNLSKDLRAKLSEQFYINFMFSTGKSRNFQLIRAIRYNSCILTVNIHLNQCSLVA